MDSVLDDRHNRGDSCVRGGFLGRLSNYLEMESHRDSLQIQSWPGVDDFPGL